MINDKLQGSVATYWRCGKIVNNQIKKGLLLSLRVKDFFLISEWIFGKLQARRDCLVHFARLANTLMKDGESAWDNHVLPSICAKYSQILKLFSIWQNYGHEFVASFLAHPVYWTFCRDRSNYRLWRTKQSQHGKQH